MTAAIGGPGVEGALMTFGPEPRNNPNANAAVDSFKAKGFDPQEHTLTTYTRNIGLRYFMGVTEKVVFSQCEHDDRATSVHKEVWIESDVFGFQSAIKKFGVDRFIPRRRQCNVSALGALHAQLGALKGRVGPTFAPRSGCGEARSTAAQDSSQSSEAEQHQGPGGRFGRSTPI